MPARPPAPWTAELLSGGRRVLLLFRCSSRGTGAGAFPVALVILFVPLPHALDAALEPAALGVLVTYLAVGARYLGNFGRYGDFSYGIYIIHFPVLQTLIGFGLFERNAYLGLGVATVLVLGAALASWHLVEKPFLRKSSHYVVAERLPEQSLIMTSDATRSPPVLVTGANGFVGTALCRALLEKGRAVRAAVRGVRPATRCKPHSPACLASNVGDIAPDTDWTQCTRGMRRSRASRRRVHMMQRYRHRSAGRISPRQLRCDAASARVRGASRRSAFRLSQHDQGATAKVDAASASRRPIRPRRRIPMRSRSGKRSRRSRRPRPPAGLEYVILRPPLVYGPGVGANFLRVLQAVDRGDPVALGSVRNRRSLLYVGNLADAIVDLPRSSGRGRQDVLARGRARTCRRPSCSSASVRRWSVPHASSRYRSSPSGSALCFSVAAPTTRGSRAIWSWTRVRSGTRSVGSRPTPCRTGSRKRLAGI